MPLAWQRMNDCAHQTLAALSEPVGHLPRHMPIAQEQDAHAADNSDEVTVDGNVHGCRRGRP